MLKHTEIAPDQTASPRPARLERRLEARDRAAYRVALIATLTCLCATFAYAYARYVHHGPIDPERVPLYITNKAVSWSAVLLLGAAMALGPLGRLWPRRCGPWVWHRKTLGLTGAALATAHLLMSLPIFNMFYYTAFFNADGTLRLATELSFLAGTVAWILLLAPVAASLPDVRHHLSARFWLHLQRWNLLMLLLVLAHAAWLGWDGWFAPATWYGGMPPITMLSCAAVALVFLIRLLAYLGDRGGTNGQAAGLDP